MTTIYSHTIGLYIEMLQKAAATAAAHSREMFDGIAKAQAQRDPDLTEQANAERRAKAVTAWREVGGEKGAELRKEHARARDYLLEAATANTKLPEDAVTIMMATQKWQGIERLVAAGATLRDTIATTTDIPTLLAISEFGPAFAAASVYREPHMQERIGNTLDGTQHDPSAGGAWVQRAVWARLAEVTPDEKLRTLLAGALNAQQQYDAAEPWFDVSDSMAAGLGGNMLGASIASHVAAAGGTYAAEPETPAA
jgi:hypothetical protein